MGWGHGELLSGSIPVWIRAYDSDRVPVTKPRTGSGPRAVRSLAHGVNWTFRANGPATQNVFCRLPLRSFPWLPVEDSSFTPQGIFVRQR